jgi:N-methylhydantoinase B
VELIGEIVDQCGTERLRNRIRDDRVTGAVQSIDATVPEGAIWLTPDVYQVGGEVRTRAGAALGVPTDWVSGAVRRIVEPQAHGPYIVLHEELELREYLCPASGRLLWSAVARKDAPDLIPVELR